MFNIIANWKMYNLESKVSVFADNIQGNASSINLILCPSYLHIPYLKGTHSFALGAQDCSEYNDYSHTGSISTKMLQGEGVSYILIAHHETRRDFSLTINQIKSKIFNALEHSLIPILCLGEERDLNSQEAAKFILSEIRCLGIDSHHFWIAYEPIWAIGTGHTPSLSHIQNVAIDVKSIMGVNTKFLYGGSINENNCQDFAAIRELDGLVIGTASHDYNRLNKIIAICAEQRGK